MRELFCVKCGKTQVPLQESLCETCYWQSHTSFTFKSRAIEINTCLECGAIMLPSGWTGSNTGEKAIFLILQNVHYWVKAPFEVDFEARQLTEPLWEDGKPSFRIEVTATDDLIEQFEPHVETKEIDVIILWGTCKACVAKRTGSKVTFQIRADGRELTKTEEKEVEQIVTKIVKQLQPENPMAFVSDVIYQTYGFDLKLATQRLGDIIMEQLVKRWVGVKDKNYKLVGEERDGTRKYALTFLFKLPHVTNDEIVRYNNRYFWVAGISKAGVELVDLKSDENISVLKYKDIQKLDPPPFHKNYLVISQDHETKDYQLMDLQDFHTFEVSGFDFPRLLHVGEEEEFLIIDENLFIDKRS